MKKVISILTDFVLDKANNGDEKRAYGGAFLVLAAFYITLIRPGDVAGFLAIAGVGGTLLGVAAFTDGIGNPPSSSSGA